MATTHDKLRAIENEVSRKEGELHVATKALRDAKAKYAEVKDTLEEYERRMNDAQAPTALEAEALTQERDLLAQAVVRVQQRRQSVQHQLEQHLARSDDVTRAIDKAKAELKSAVQRTMELRRTQRKIDCELQEVQSSNKELISTLEASTRRSKVLAERAARLTSQYQQSVQRRDALKEGCVVLAKKQDSLSEMLTSTREACSRLFSLLEQPAVSKEKPAEPSGEEARTDIPSVPLDAANEQASLMVEYRSTIERLLAQTA